MNIEHSARPAPQHLTHLKAQAFNHGNTMERNILLTMTETVAVLADLIIKQHLKVDAMRTAVIGMTCTVSSFPELREPLFKHFELAMKDDAKRNNEIGYSAEVQRLRNEWLAVLMPQDFWKKMQQAT
ncbi:hypothetical protein ACFWP0_03540 [Achromobacter sp. NPDC058515]|uniref:hypothetical protein n=1 Tax=Achromobacter sp. NPDC058515 TaxID=3346533 RepID=UPI0036625A33